MRRHITAIKPAAVVTVVLICLPGITSGREVTLSEALDIALQQTGRGRIIEGNLEVAEQQYFAEKINFYVPEISINGSLPAYRVNETYDFFPGTDVKGFGRSTRFDLDADITLRQNLFTGGDLTVAANLVRNEWDYPLRRSRIVSGDTVFVTQTIDENRRLGTFNFSLEQPLLQPSTPRFDLHNAADDLELARISQIEEVETLKQDLLEAYFGVLLADVELQIGNHEMESARISAEVDSMKLLDAVIDEEAWLESASARLDAELNLLEDENTLNEQRRSLVSLLAWEVDEPLQPVVPESVEALTQKEQKAYIANWSESAPVRRAEYEFDKAERAADFAAGSHGLNGSLAASYGLDRGTVEDNIPGYVQSEDLQTDSWSVSLNFSYPLWDGGASSAEVKAARLSQEQARLELEKVRKSTQADIMAQIDKANLAYRKLDVLSRQIDIARQQLDIAQGRYEDGQISKLTLLEYQIAFREARKKYLEQTRDYLLARVELEGNYGY
jgi:outer membrane protein TolC